jgi:protein TonB
LSATTYTDQHYGGRASPRRRALSLLLAIALEVLLLLAFFTYNFQGKDRPEFAGGRISTFDVAAPSAEETASPADQQEEDIAEPAPPAPPRPVPPVPVPRVELPPPKLQMIEVTREVYRASDIAKLGSNAPGFQRQSGGGASPGDSARVGTAPDGQPLYAAQWYREPTSTELSAYLPRRMPEGGGWGMIACKTAERYRVTDCVELENSPAGSHLAGSVRQAAWQFLVRPPRVGGKPMIGEWVRIRITYSQERPSAGE